MVRPTSKHPTVLELEILKILWRAQPLTGRQLRDALAEFRELAYTSVMTILGIMVDKGYVRRKKQGGGLRLFHENQARDDDPSDAARSCRTCL